MRPAELMADGLSGLQYDSDIVDQSDGSPMGSELDDYVLMARIGDRQPEALRLLYNRHSPVLLGLCLRVLKDRAEAEQILIDVFWEAWERADRYDPSRAAPRTYLTMMTRSRALDVLRRRRAALGNAGNDRSATTFALDGTLPSTELAPLNRMLAGERSESVRDALLSLDDDERSLIEACFYDGYTHAALAAKLRQPLGTVKTRIRRGLARLRTKLRYVFEEPGEASRNAGDGESKAQ
jgi:RNA polymerase sigma-70 factor, ECF subfamily